MLLMLKQFSFSPTVVLCAFQWFLFMFHQVKMLLQYDEVWLSDLLATYSGVMHVVVSGFWYVVVCLVLCVLVPGQSLVGMSSNFDRVDNSWQLKFGSENGFFFFFFFYVGGDQICDFYLASFFLINLVLVLCIFMENACCHETNQSRVTTNIF
jgi:hypothetical protein